MVWLNWRGALIIVSAWVALACGQAFTQSGAAPTTGKAERILTLYENGKPIRCRVVGTWQEPDGKTAHQLQALESGELITIVESGAAAPVSAEGRRTIRTRNFHWGVASRTPPRGCPTPPTHIMTACCGPDSGITQVSHGLPKDALVHAGPPLVLNSKTVSERINWWEEKDGQRISPIITTDGKNPFETDPSKPSLTVAPPVGRGPVIMTPGPEVIVSKEVPMIVCPPTTTPAPKNVGKVVAVKPPPAVAPREVPKAQPFKIEGTTPKTFTTSEPMAPKKIDRLPPPKEVAKAEEPKKDWRAMWGQGNDSTVDQPGKSLVPAAVKPGSGPGGVRTADALPKDNILLHPDKFTPAPKGVTPAGEGRPPVTELPLTAPVDRPGAVVSRGLPAAGPGSVPYGAQSVLAAKSGLPGQITYIPVPVTTIPEPLRPPMPPPPNMPEAPQPTAFVNAFTPPPAPMAKTPPMSNPYGMMPAGGVHPGMARSGMVYPGMYPGMHPGMNPAMMNPAMMNPAMMNPAMMNPAAYATPMNPYNSPRTYAGPMPPNPFPAMPAQPVMPASYTPPPAASANIGQLLGVLRESLYPAQREWAAVQLANHDWRMQPEILPALILAAKSDPAATVRAGCVNTLARTNAATGPVVETFHALKSDTDPRVRQEAENALVRMGMSR